MTTPASEVLPGPQSGHQPLPIIIMCNTDIWARPPPPVTHLTQVVALYSQSVPVTVHLYSIPMPRAIREQLASYIDAHMVISLHLSVCFYTFQILCFTISVNVC